MANEIQVAVSYSANGWCVTYSLEDGNAVRYSYCGTEENARNLAGECVRDPRFLAEAFKHAERI